MTVSGVKLDGWMGSKAQKYYNIWNYNTKNISIFILNAWNYKDPDGYILDFESLTDVKEETTYTEWAKGIPSGDRTF